MAAKLKHVAIVSSNYQLLGEFYSQLFGMTSTRGDQSTQGAVTVSDGYVGMNINPRAPGRQAGFDHFGILVEDVETIRARLQDDYPNIELLQRPSNRPFAGISMHDPAGQVFDLSQDGMENRRGIYVDLTDQHAPRHISHITLRTVDPLGVARFYRNVFEFQERERAPGDPNYYLTDGTVTLVVAPWRISDFAGSGIERPALDHLGFEVESLEAFQADVERLAASNPALAPTMKRGPEGEARMRLLSTCCYGQYQLADPDGVLLDVAGPR